LFHPNRSKPAGYSNKIKEEGDMGKAKSKRDVSPDKKPGPLTKKERKERKKKRKEKHQ
jgi:hypothetical protein